MQDHIKAAATAISNELLNNAAVAEAVNARLGVAKSDDDEAYYAKATLIYVEILAEAIKQQIHV